MRLEDYIGKWGAVNIGGSVHEDDKKTLENYPFKGQYHKCIGVDKEYLVLRFSCIQIRVLEQNFRVIDTPYFFPFDTVKYVSSKGKLEIGTVVSFSFKWKPNPHKVYILSVKGKVKSTLYERDRLTLIQDTSEVLKKRESLSKIISHALRHEPDKYGLILDLEGWVKMDELIEALKKSSPEWQSLQYHDILKMIDLTKKKRHEVMVQRIGPEYKNTYDWFIRVK